MTSSHGRTNLAATLRLRIAIIYFTCAFGLTPAKALVTIPLPASASSPQIVLVKLRTPTRNFTRASRDMAVSELDQDWTTLVDQHLLDEGTFGAKEFWPDVNRAIFHQRE